MKSIPLPNEFPTSIISRKKRAFYCHCPKTGIGSKRCRTEKSAPTAFVNINSNKYSVPVKYVGKTVQFRIIYGFRIELYDSTENYILGFEQTDKKYQTVSNSEHYEPIAPKISTSIPQIRRDFTQRYKNGVRYLDAAGRKFDQPTHYARKIMELQELYSSDVMDALIGIAVDEDRMDIKGFKALLKEYNDGKRKFETVWQKNPNAHPVQDQTLTRDCSYYEDVCKGDVPCRQ